MKIANATPMVCVAAPSIRDGTGAVPYGAPCLMTLSSSPPCQRFDSRMRNIGAGGVYGYLSTARIDDQIHVLHRHCAQQHFIADHQGADVAKPLTERDLRDQRMECSGLSHPQQRPLSWTPLSGSVGEQRAQEYITSVPRYRPMRSLSREPNPAALDYLILFLQKMSHTATFSFHCIRLRSLIR